MSQEISDRELEISFSVKDTGIGIPASKLVSIFEMFSQVESALARSQGGLGIGLCLVKRIIEMHDGQIEARSEGPNLGSEFLVRLPVITERPFSCETGIEASQCTAPGASPCFTGTAPNDRQRSVA